MSPTKDPRVSIPLQSDPRWLNLGIGGTLAVANALFVWLFMGSRLHPALGLLPGMTLAVFAGGALGHWGRRRGGTLSLEASTFRLELRAEDERHELIDLTAPYSAMLLRGRNDARRMLVLAQRDEPTVVLEQGRGTATPPEEAWRGRTAQVDLDVTAVSPASAQVVTVAHGATMDALLAHLAPSVEPDAPWFLHPSQGGDPLRVDAREVSIGSRVVPVTGDLKVLDYAIGAKGSAVGAIGLAGDEGALMLIGGEEAAVRPGAVVSDLVPDAYLPMTGFELLRAVVQAAISEARGGADR